jgi:hypothetical protein
VSTKLSSSVRPNPGDRPEFWDNKLTSRKQGGNRRIVAPTHWKRKIVRR